MKHPLTFLLFLSSALGLSAANPSFTDMFNALAWTNDTANLKQKSGSSLGITGTVFSIGLNNVGIGEKALKQNTGSNNVAIGLGAMWKSVAGYGNVAIGFSTLTNTSEGDNVAIGRQALEQNTSGVNNIAIGQNASISNTFGANNIAIGKTALRNMTGESDNVAFGNLSMKFLFNGFENTALGNNTMDLQDTCYKSTAVGYGTLDKMTGSQNVALGHSAGLNAQGGGDYNTFLGADSGRGGLNLSQTVGIGGIALQNASAITNSVAIGYNSTATGNGQMVFGNGISNNFFGGNLSFPFAVIDGAGTGSTNYTLQGTHRKMYLGSSNVNIVAVMQTPDTWVRYCSVSVSNLSANTWGFNFSQVTNRVRWRDLATGSTNQPTVLTNNSELRIDFEFVGTNGTANYQYFKPGL
jgi:hypothetical protein